MVQRRQHLRFALEPRTAIGILREGRWEDFDRDISTQPRVPGAVHLTHAADAERTGNFVRTEARADRKRHEDGLDYMAGNADRRSVRATD